MFRCYDSYEYNGRSTFVRSDKIIKENNDSVMQISLKDSAKSTATVQQNAGSVATTSTIPKCLGYLDHKKENKSLNKEQWSLGSNKSTVYGDWMNE